MVRAFFMMMAAVPVIYGCGDFPLSPKNETGPIIFVSNLEGKGQSQIYAMNAEGTNKRQLTF